MCFTGWKWFQSCQQCWPQRPDLHAPLLLLGLLSIQGRKRWGFFASTCPCLKLKIKEESEKGLCLCDIKEERVYVCATVAGPQPAEPSGLTSTQTSPPWNVADRGLKALSIRWYSVQTNIGKIKWRTNLEALQLSFPFRWQLGLPVQGGPYTCKQIDWKRFFPFWNNVAIIISLAKNCYT